MQKALVAIRILACFFLICGGLAIAQVTTADILGTVTDASGAVLANAKVTVENLDTHDIRSAQTTQSGEYVFTLLPIGRYAVRVEASGFKAYAVPNIVLASGDRARVNAQMEIGQMAETVHVEAQAPALQSDSSTVGTLVTQQSVQDLPLNGRNFIVLAQSAPGTTAGAPNALSSGTRPDDRRQTSTIAVGAQGSQVNNYMVDGMDNNDRAIGTVIIKPSVDALSEFRVQTNTYTAEVGRTSGGVVNLITRSGTNGIHGSAYEFFRNDKMDAAPFFAPAGTKPEFRQNQYGGSIGGPIRKDKTFFFGDAEEFTLRQGIPFVITVPTLDMRKGNFSALPGLIYDPTKSPRAPFQNNTIPASQINSIAANYMTLYPVPTSSSLSNNFAAAFPKSQDAITTDARIDHRFSERDYFYARYSFNDTTSFLPGSMPIVNGIYPGGNAGQFPGNALQRAQGVQLNQVHIFGPNLLLELKAGWVRYASQTQPLNAGKNVSQQFGLNGANYGAESSGLSIMTPAGYEALGDANFIPIHQIDNTFQYQGNLTWTRGAHNIKFGAGLIRRQFTVAQSANPRGSFNYDSNATNGPTAGSGNPIASFLLGFPATVTFVDALVWPGYRSWEPSVFVQDDWRATRWLTLNIGLRYDIFTPFTEVANRISNISLTTNKIDIAGKNGVSDTAGVRTDYKDIAPRFGFAATIGHGMVIRGGFGLSFTPGQYMSQAFLKNPPFISAFSVTNDVNNPTYNIAQGLPPAVPADPSNPPGSIIATADNLRSTYTEQASLSVQKEFWGNVLSVGYVGAFTRHIVIYPNIDQPLPGAGSVNPRRPYFSQFPALTSISYMTDDGTLNYNSMQVTFERRLKAGLTVNSNYTLAHALSTALTSGTAVQVMNNWHLEYGNSNLDVRHRFVALVNYEIPFGKSLTGFRKQLLAGWQTNGIFSYQTGFPFNVTNNTARANTGAGDRPDRIATGTVSNPTISHWFDTTAFVAQALNTAGNSGVFPLYGPPQRHFDFSLFKNFELHERLRLQFRAEAFNITNTPSFSNPASALGASTFGTISSTSLPNRQLQLALKLLF